MRRAQFQVSTLDPKAELAFFQIMDRISLMVVPRYLPDGTCFMVLLFML